MRSWTVVIPAYKRVEELYEGIEANTDIEAIEIAIGSSPDSILEDSAYYNRQPEAAEVIAATDEPLTLTTTRADLKALDAVLNSNGLCYSDFLSEPK
jgi:hypothetical protein